MMEYCALRVNVHTILSISVLEHELFRTFFHDTLVFPLNKEEEKILAVPLNNIILIFVNAQPKISVIEDIPYFIQELGSSLIYLCDSLNV